MGAQYFSGIDPQDCAGPAGTFPVRDAKDLSNVNRMASSMPAPHMKNIMRNAESIAKRKSITMPEDWGLLNPP